MPILLLSQIWYNWFTTGDSFIKIIWRYINIHLKTQIMRTLQYFWSRLITCQLNVWDQVWDTSHTLAIIGQLMGTFQMFQSSCHADRSKFWCTDCLGLQSCYCNNWCVVWSWLSLTQSVSAAWEMPESFPPHVNPNQATCASLRWTKTILLAAEGGLAW